MNEYKEQLDGVLDYLNLPIAVIERVFDRVEYVRATGDITLYCGFHCPIEYYHLEPLIEADPATLEVLYTLLLDQLKSHCFAYIEEKKKIRELTEDLGFYPW